jgi:hypothetical protein
MQAIITRYLPPTNVRGSRVKASCARGSITVPFSYEGDPHIAAADALVAKFIAEDAAQYGTPKNDNPWGKARVVGQSPSGDLCHVFIS